MAKPMLKVRLVGEGMIPDYEAMEQGVMRYHGWKYDSTLGDPVVVFENMKAKKVRPGGFVRAEDPVDLELSFRAEYLQEVRAGALEPLDEASAHLCGVPFHSQ